MERGGKAEIVEAEGGPFEDQAIRFGCDAWLYLISDADITVVASVRHEQHPWEGCEAVAGKWNEHG